MCNNFGEDFEPIPRRTYRSLERAESPVSARSVTIHPRRISE